MLYLSHLNVLWAGSNGLDHPHVHRAGSAAPMPLLCTRRAAGLNHAVQPVATPEVVAAVQANAQHADVAARDEIDLVCKGAAGDCSTSPLHSVRSQSTLHAHGCCEPGAFGEQGQSWNHQHEVSNPGDVQGRPASSSWWAAGQAAALALLLMHASRLTQITTQRVFTAAWARLHPTLPLGAHRERVTLAGLTGPCRLTCGTEAKLQLDLPGVLDCQEAWLPTGNGGPWAPCLICAPQQHIGACCKEERLLLCEDVPRGLVACQGSARQVVRAADGSLCQSSGAHRVQEQTEESQLRSAPMNMHVAVVGMPWMRLKLLSS